MIREPLHQFYESGAFYQRHSTVLLSFLKNYIARRVQLGKAVRTRIREPRDNVKCQMMNELLKPMYLNGCFFSSSDRITSRVLSSMDFVFSMTKRKKGCKLRCKLSFDICHLIISGYFKGNRMK